MSPRIASALDYLATTDFTSVPDGRHELDEDRLIAIMQRYRVKPLEAAKGEAHRRYIDVQYVVAGAERMGYLPLREGLAVRSPYDAAKDIVFFEAYGDLIEVPEGSFVVFMPHDVHAPGLMTGKASDRDEVVKVVMKCRVDDD